MATDVDICNLALAHLAQAKVITSIDPPDNNVEADYCKRFYPIALKRLLEAHAWSFAVRRAALTKFSESDVDHWAFAYSVPNLMVRALAVLPPESTDEIRDAKPFAIDTRPSGERVVRTNQDDAVLKYISFVDDYAKFSPSFVTCLARLLAYYLAGPVTKKMSVVESQYKLFLGELAAAAALDAAGSTYTDYRRTYTPEHLRAREGF